MATDIDRQDFLSHLEKSLTEKDKAARLGKELAKQGIDRIFLVGCGAPNREMGAIKYWMDRDLQKIETHLYFPAEFIRQNPAKLGANSLVILASHSGTTPEIVEAAEFLKAYPCKVVGVTQFEDSPLAKNVPHALMYGKSNHGYFAKFIIIMALLAAVMKETEGWPLFDKVMTSLDALPSAMVDAMETNEKRGNRRRSPL